MLAPPQSNGPQYERPGHNRCISGTDPNVQGSRIESTRDTPKGMHGPELVRRRRFALAGCTLGLFAGHYTKRYFAGELLFLPLLRIRFLLDINLKYSSFLALVLCLSCHFDHYRQLVISIFVRNPTSTLAHTNTRTSLPIVAPSVLSASPTLVLILS